MYKNMVLVYSERIDTELPSPESVKIDHDDQECGRKKNGRRGGKAVELHTCLLVYYVVRRKSFSSWVGLPDITPAVLATSTACSLSFAQTFIDLGHFNFTFGLQVQRGRAFMARMG
jgi:hypothetical protein